MVGMREATCVILAAGLGTRMGGENKLLRPFRNGTLLEAVLKACADYPTVVVAPTKVAVNARTIDLLLAMENEVTFVVNDEPKRGMAHSLRLAHEGISRDRSIAVLLADKPLVTKELIRRVLAVADADVTYPVRDGMKGHPVVFSPLARLLIPNLAEGDTLQQLRDASSLTRHAVPIDDDGAYVDVDTEEDYRAACERANRAGSNDTR